MLEYVVNLWFVKKPAKCHGTHSRVATLSSWPEATTVAMQQLRRDSCLTTGSDRHTVPSSDMECYISPINATREGEDKEIMVRRYMIL